MNWQDLTTTAIAAYDRSTPVVLPLAAIEQHGPHLPVATDRMINEHFCERLNAELGRQVLILPTCSVGCSLHHMDFSGTLSLSHETFMNAALEILGCVVQHGFRNLVLLNSHGGNQGAGQVTAERFGHAHPDCRIVMISWWRLAAEALRPLNESGAGGVGHACEFETSLMELIAPELIDRDAIAPGGNNPTWSWADGDMLRGSRAMLHRSMKQATANGVFGSPQFASREKGQAISDHVTAALKVVLRDLAEADRSSERAS